MKIKKIKTQDNYNLAIAHLEAIGDRDDFQDDAELIEEFDLIEALVGVYKRENFRLTPGHPIEIIKLKMDSLGIKQKDLVPLIGSTGVVSEVFSEKKALSKEMIRQFSRLLHIDQEILNVNYDLTGKAH